MQIQQHYKTAKSIKDDKNFDVTTVSDQWLRLSLIYKFHHFGITKNITVQLRFYTDENDEKIIITNFKLHAYFSLSI